MTDTRRALLVIPAYKERHRLPAFLDELLPAIGSSDLDIGVQVVDDGSGASEQEFLRRDVQRRQGDFPFLQPPLLNPEHRGKGYAIYTGWRKDSRAADSLAFVDADGSVAPADILALMRMALAGDGADAMLIASRKPTPATRVHRRFMRRSLNRLFALAVNALFRLSVYDSQCGFKIIPAAFFSQVESALREDGFCLDVELLARAHAADVPIREIPINWSHKVHNRLHLLKDGLSMLAQLVRLRFRMRTR